MKSVDSSCIICGSDTITTYGKFSQYKSEAFYCRSCDSFFPSQLPNVEEVISYYQGFNFNEPKGTFFRRWINNRTFVQKAKHIEAVITKHNKGKKLLDFGGGCGNFTKGFAQIGYDSWLYEIDQSAVAIAKQNGVNILTEREGSFDIIFTSHVIEHFIYLTDFFKEVSSLLKTGGTLVIALPNKNIQEWYRSKHVKGYLDILPERSMKELKENPWFCIDPPRHNYALSSKSIRVLAANYGYDILEDFTEYCNRGSFYHNNQYSLLNFSTFITRPWRFLNNVYITMMSAIMSRKYPQGGENLCLILRKK
ncbi:MAG: class I SAM-dependent methyltransferase [Bacteroidota bacterium]